MRIDCSIITGTGLEGPCQVYKRRLWDLRKICGAHLKLPTHLGVA